MQLIFDVIVLLGTLGKGAMLFTKIDLFCITHGLSLTLLTLNSISILTFTAVKSFFQ